MVKLSIEYMDMLHRAGQVATLLNKEDKKFAQKRIGALILNALSDKDDEGKAETAATADTAATE